jgi:hypothetical protein
MVQMEIFATLGQSVAGATLVAQKQVNTWLQNHPDVTLHDFRLQTQIIREAPEIIWCIIALTYRRTELIEAVEENPPAYNI